MRDMMMNRRDVYIIIVILVLVFLRLSTNIFLHDTFSVTPFVLSDLEVELKWYYFDLVSLLNSSIALTLMFFLTYKRQAFIIYKILLTASIISYFRLLSYLLFGLVYDHYFLSVLFLDVSTYSIYVFTKKYLNK